MGWSEVIKAALEKFGLRLQSADYKNLRVALYHNDNQAQVVAADDGLDPALARHLTVLAALYGYDGSYLQRLRVDSAYWLKARVKHSLEMKRVYVENQTVDPLTTTTLLDAAAHGMVYYLYVKVSGVSDASYTAGLSLDDIDVLVTLRCPKVGWLTSDWNLAEKEEALGMIRLIERDTTNNVYRHAIKIELPFIDSITLKLANNHDTDTATIWVFMLYSVVSSSTRLKFTLSEDIAGYDPHVIAVEAESVLGVVRDSPRGAVQVLLGKESLEEGQPPTNTLELILDRDYSDDELEELISYVEREYNAKLIARW